MGHLYTQYPKSKEKKWGSKKTLFGSFYAQKALNLLLDSKHLLAP
jgi:hypothetical protein